jgi:hypothetical protein
MQYIHKYKRSLIWFAVAIVFFLLTEIFRTKAIITTGVYEQDCYRFYVHKIALLSLVLPFFTLVPGKIKPYLHWLIIILTPAVCFFLLEFYVSFPQDIPTGSIVANLILFYLFAATLAFLFGRTAVPTVFLCVFSVGYGFLNYYVAMYHGSPIFPWDIYSLSTAASVADKYTYSIYPYMGFIFTSGALLALINIACSQRIRFTAHRFVRPGCFMLSLISLIGMGVYLQTDSAVNTFKLNDDHFDTALMSQQNGCVVNFVYNIQYLFHEKPDSYSDELLSEIPAGVEESAGDIDNAPTKIIAIMVESLSDLTVVSDYETSSPVFPFLSSLEENTVKGQLHVSVRGGGTCNTEFEFLSGMSIANYQGISAIYQQNINRYFPTLVSQFNSLDYETVAIHPYHGAAYSRNKAYEYFGFDEAYFLDSFDDAPTLRGLVTDQAMFERLMDIYNSSNEPMFIFGITMQDHGGYTSGDLTLDTYINGVDSEYVSTYLSLMRETDRALENLITQLSQSDEKTLLLIFGDHQPSDVISQPIIDFAGTVAQPGTLEYTDNFYTTPYIIWANYDMDYDMPSDISANYLSSVLVDIAGLPKTKANNYMLSLMSEYPVITKNILMDSSGKISSSDEISSIPLLNEYACLQYNYTYDERLSDFWEYN